MIDLALIGIGTGNPDHMTLQGIEALGKSDLVLLPLKSDDTSDLADLRRDIIDRFGPKDVPVVAFTLPVRDEAIADYETRVDAWHDAVAKHWRDAIETGLGGDASGQVALLIWGDPTLYDSSLRLAQRVGQSLHLSITVIPGITAIQALCAAHRIPLNEIGEPIHITTGRQLRQNGWPVGARSVVVMLDGTCAFECLRGQGLEIWWGAYLGMPHETLLSGRLDDVSQTILNHRNTCKNTHGWIMDTYLMRKPSKARQMRQSITPLDPKASRHDA